MTTKQLAADVMAAYGAVSPQAACLAKVLRANRAAITAIRSEIKDCHREDSSCEHCDRLRKVLRGLREAVE